MKSPPKGTRRSPCRAELSVTSSLTGSTDRKVRAFSPIVADLRQLDAQAVQLAHDQCQLGLVLDVLLRQLREVQP